MGKGKVCVYTVDSTQTPFFSIVIPVYNREKEIVRALKSCLAQSFKNIEVVVVDDASEDQTREAVLSSDDQRVVLITHEKNCGVCPARNTGINHSHGEWVLFLDSDDELLPGAIQKIYEKAVACSEHVDRLGFIYLRDDGRFSPQPFPAGCVLDYESYVSWSAIVSPNDFFQCTRRRVFEKVRFANSRAYEITYLLDFAKEYRTQMIPEIVAVVHTDSSNRDTNITDRELIQAFIRDARDEAEAMEWVLSEHGAVLQKQAPKRHRMYKKAQVLFNFLGGSRVKGSRLAFEYLRAFPGCLEGWIIWLAGLCGPYTLAQVKVWKLRGFSIRQQKTAKA